LPRGGVDHVVQATGHERRPGLDDDTVLRVEGGGHQAIAEGDADVAGPGNVPGVSTRSPATAAAGLTCGTA